jgi:mannose-1-phosphate guanylyltransferase/phosphomannomutase
VGAANNPSAVILKNALITGIQSTGRDVWDFGNNFESLFTYGMNICNLNLGTFIDGNEHCTIKLYSENGLSATRDVERSLEATLLSGDYNRSHWSNFAKLNDMKGISAIYRQHLKKLAPFSLKDVNAVVYSENKQIENMMNETLKNLGVNLSDDTVINIDKNGTTVSIKSRNCYDSLSYWRIFTICCLSEFEKGYDISIPIDAPQIIDKIAQGYNVNVYRYFRCPAGNVDEKARQITKDQLWVRDALIMSIKFLSFLKISGKSIAQLHEIIPEFSLSSRTVISDKNPAALIRELAEINKKFLTKVSEGILINYENGYALIRPLKQGKGINILAESARTEFATEICDNIQNLIKEAKS